MGQAKLKRQKAVPTVYHHTSVLRTNLIWMSGVIEVEGRCGPVAHPQLGEIRSDANLRRAMKDFPPLAWFTSKLDVPRCLVDVELRLVDKDTNEVSPMRLPESVANAMSLNRLALGFPIADIPVVRWPEHPGYDTDEGRDLNASARDVGDNPDDWWVSEVAVDVMKASEVWFSPRMSSLKLKRSDQYLQDVKKMVELCRSQTGVYIPPTWLKQEEAEMIARMSGRIPISVR